MVTVRMTYQDAIEHGPAVEYFPNGSKQVRGQSAGGHAVGEWREWYQDSTLKAEGMNRQSVAIGTHRKWHRTGRLAMEKRFDDNGRRTAEQHWDAGGKPVSFGRTGMPEQSP